MLASHDFHKILLREDKNIPQQQNITFPDFSTEFLELGTFSHKNAIPVWCLSITLWAKFPLGILACIYDKNFKILI